MENAKYTDADRKKVELEIKKQWEQWHKRLYSNDRKMIEIPRLTLEIGLPESFQFSIHRGHRGCPRGDRWSRHPQSLDRPGDRSRRIAKLQGKWSIGDPALKGFPVMDLLNSSRFILVQSLKKNNGNGGIKDYLLMKEK
jgi:hypothetical protein